MTATPQERLAAIAERVSPCPAPAVMQGFDQCAHGPWPCEQTEVAWRAHGIERQDEMRKLREYAVQEAAIQDAEWETQQELGAAAREGRPPYWETDTEVGQS